MELQSSEDVVNVKPRFEKMLGFPGRGGVIVTAPATADSEYDYISRFFCPKSGLNEVLSLTIPAFNLFFLMWKLARRLQVSIIQR